MKKKLKGLHLRIVTFLVAAVILVCSLNGIMKFKYYDGFKQMKSFYELDNNSVDIMVIGSSHAYNAFHPCIFWNNFGYSSFVLASSNQPIWNSYYYMEEALKTQTPKVIIFEGYRLTMQEDYTSPSYAIKATYGLNWSKTKLDAMRASFTDDKLESYLFPFGAYHSRYNELSREDFAPNFDSVYFENYKGDLNSLNVYELSQPNVEAYDKTPNQITPKVEEYYRKMAELAKANNIPLITVVAPFNISQQEYSYYKYAEQISEEYGMPFININELYDKLGIDFAKDFGDKYGHVNLSGSTKVTDYIGNHIGKNYAMTDHRGDSFYDSWQINSDEFTRYYSHDNIDKIDSAEQLISKCLEDGDYEFIFIINGKDATEESDDVLKKCFSLLGTDYGKIDDGIYVFNNGNLKKIDCKDSSKGYKFDVHNDAYFGYKEIKFNTFFNENVYYAHINDTEKTYTMPYGVTIITYDKKFDTVSDISYFENDTNKLSRVNEYLDNK